VRSRVLGLLAVMVVSTAAWGAVERPVVPVKNCIQGECHAKERNYKFQHGPAALGACDVCHMPADEKNHTYTLKQKDKALCDFCHVEKLAAAKVVHKPVADGQCLGCHNPHGSGVKAMLRRDDLGKLCADCHKDVTQGRKHVHGPVAAGSCAACHNAHRSDLPKLLVGQGRELCLGCHDQMSKQLATVKVLHKPMQGDCQQCHEVHASNEIMQLKQSPVGLCVSCHDPVKQLAESAKFKHSPVMHGDGCIACHTPHGSDLAKLMKSDPAKACLTCHDKAITMADKRVVPAVAEIADKKLSLHGPIREGNCAGCHTPHGGPVSRLLSKPYPETFYESFEVEKYALCFSCHDKQLVLLDKTTGLTNFRNGDQNLHYAHVNKTDKGRSCRACHSTHASAHPAHVRESVPYGKWELPINFKPTKTGGSCAPGCHQEFGYDRVKAVPMPSKSLTAPATRPSAEVTRK
jgi:predicted CXXCH cytochrome family protein